MQKEKVINLLRDDSQYYGDFGKKYLSASDIGNLINNPKMFGVREDTNANFELGKYFHQSILEPEKIKDFVYVEASTRSTKLYKDFLSKSNLPYALLRKELLEADTWVEKMVSNISFYDEIYKEGNSFEVPEIGEIEGFMFKGKADIVSDEFVIDLKTTRDIDGFYYSAKKYNYDSQAFIYKTLFGKPMRFFVVDKVTLQLGMFDCTDEFYERGREKVKRAIEVYERFFGDNATEDVDNYFIKQNLY